MRDGAGEQCVGVLQRRDVQEQLEEGGGPGVGLVVDGDVEDLGVVAADGGDEGAPVGDLVAGRLLLRDHESSHARSMVGFMRAGRAPGRARARRAGAYPCPAGAAVRPSPVGLGAGRRSPGRVAVELLGEHRLVLLHESRLPPPQKVRPVSPASRWTSSSMYRFTLTPRCCAIRRGGLGRGLVHPARSAESSPSHHASVNALAQQRVGGSRGKPGRRGVPPVVGCGGERSSTAYTDRLPRRPGASWRSGGRPPKGPASVTTVTASAGWWHTIRRRCCSRRTGRRHWGRAQ